MVVAVGVSADEGMMECPAMLLANNTMSCGACQELTGCPAMLSATSTVSYKSVRCQYDVLQCSGSQQYCVLQGSSDVDRMSNSAAGR